MVVTLGTFDGVHLGHQAILKQVSTLAHQVQGESMVITFDPHPRMVLFPDDPQLQLIQTTAEKLAWLEKSNIHHVIVQPFTKGFSRISADTFLQEILLRSLHAKALVIGYDHRFGKNREGDIHTLRKLAEQTPLEIKEIPAQMVEELNVSSTKIRQAILQGEVHMAEILLGHPFSISGVVYRGEQMGRKFGYPTANITLPDAPKLLPAHGVYAVEVYLPENFTPIKGVLNLGMRPTVSGKKLQCEVHLMDFEGELYDQILQVHFKSFIRPEIKFESVERLKTQISLDVQTALSLLE